MVLVNGDRVFHSTMQVSTLSRLFPRTPLSAPTVIVRGVALLLVPTFIAVLLSITSKLGVVAVAVEASRATSEVEVTPAVVVACAVASTRTMATQI